MSEAILLIIGMLFILLTNGFAIFLFWLAIKEESMKAGGEMSDLISRQAVLDIIQGELALRCGYDADIALFSVKKCVTELPTAYDVEKVVAELEIAKEKVAKEDYCRTKHYIENDCEHKDCFKCCAEYLIDIVRKGGAE